MVVVGSIMPGDFIERLIIEIEKHPIIYDKSLTEFKDTERKERVCLIFSYCWSVFLFFNNPHFTPLSILLLYMDSCFHVL